jgi:hypothetical protein
VYIRIMGAEASTIGKLGEGLGAGETLGFPELLAGAGLFYKGNEIFDELGNFVGYRDDDTDIGEGGVQPAPDDFKINDRTRPPRFNDPNTTRIPAPGAGTRNPPNADNPFGLQLPDPNAPNRGVPSGADYQLQRPDRLRQRTPYPDRPNPYGLPPGRRTGAPPPPPDNPPPPPEDPPPPDVEDPDPDEGVPRRPPDLPPLPPFKLPERPDTDPPVVPPTKPPAYTSTHIDLENMKWRPEAFYAGEDFEVEDSAQSNLDAVLFNAWDAERALNPTNDPDNALWKLNLQDNALKYKKNATQYTIKRPRIKGNSQYVKNGMKQAFDTKVTQMATTNAYPVAPFQDRAKFIDPIRDVFRVSSIES